MEKFKEIQIICKYVQRKADGLLCMKGENFGARCCTENCPIIKKIMKWLL